MQGNEGAAWRRRGEKMRQGEREIISREGGRMGKGRFWRVEGGSGAFEDSSLAG